MTEARKAPTVAIGATGLKQYGGYIQEEYLNELSGDRWWKVVHEMSTADPTITGILFAIQMLIRNVTFTVTPFSEDQQDKDDAAFVESCIHDMRDSFQLTLSEIMSFLPWGYAPLEVVYKIRGGEVHKGDGTVDALRSSQHDDGKVGWACWSIRSQDTIVRWEFDEHGEAIAFEQQPPPGYVSVRVPLGKCLHFRTSSRKSNPEGVSMLRGAYRPWYFKKRIENIEGIGIERDLVGIPEFDLPAEMLDPNAPAEYQTALNHYKQMGQNLRNDEQSCIIMPLAYDENGREQYRFKLVSAAGTRQFDMGKIVERYDSRIAMTVLADFILIGHQQVGSYSLVSSKTNLFATALGAWLDSICSVIQGRIPELLRFNGMDVKREPKLTHGDVEKIDLGALGEFLKALTGAQAGGLFNGPAGPRIQRYLLEQAGMPTPTEAEAQQAADEEQQKAEKEAQDRAAQLAMLNNPPPPPPNAQQDEPAIAAERDPLDAVIDAVLDEAFALAGEAE